MRVHHFLFGPGAILLIASMLSAVEPDIDLLLRKLHDDQPTVRKKAARAIGSLGAAGRKAIDPLAKRLTIEPDGKARKAMVSAMAQIGPDAVPALTRFLQSGSERLRFAAISALGSMGPDGIKALPVLIRGLSSRDLKFRRLCIGVIRRMGTPAVRAAPKLVECLGSTEVVRSEAVKALRHMGSGPIPSLIDGLSSSDRKVQFWSATLLALHGSESKDGVKPLGKLLISKDDKVRAAALTALMEIGAPAVSEQAELMKIYLAERDPILRRIAAKALIRIGKPAVAGLAFHLAHEEPIQQVRLLTLITQIGPKAWEAVPTLIALIPNRDDDIRRLAILALGAVGPKAAAARLPLIALEKDKNSDVRVTAALALVSIFPGNIAFMDRFQKEMKRTTYGKPSKATLAQFDTKLQRQIEQYLDWYVKVNDTDFGKGLTKGSKRAISQLGQESIPAITRTLNKLHTINGGKLKGPNIARTPAGSILLDGERTFYYI